MAQERPQHADERTPAHAPDDEDIRALVTRLSRRHRSGGRVIERAAVVASGSDGDAIIAWIVAHDGRPESEAPAAAGHGGPCGPWAGPRPPPGTAACTARVPPRARARRSVTCCPPARWTDWAPRDSPVWRRGR